MVSVLPLVKTVGVFAISALLVTSTLRPLAAADAPTVAAPPLATAKKTFYVMVDPASDKQTASIVTIATAAELNKKLQLRGAARLPSDIEWAVPEPGWQISDLVRQCLDDPNAVGAIILAYYAGDATHFWLLWQTQTTTFEMSAQVVSCNRSDVTEQPEKPGPETVAIISQLHGSKGTPWIERRTDASVPLLSGVALVALITRTATKSAPTNVVTVATIGTAVLGQAFNKDIPGYSQPIRYRLDAQHVGVDVITEIRWLCGQPEVTGPEPVQTPTGELATLCKSFNWPVAAK